MNDHTLVQFVTDAVQYLERIAIALEKLAEEPKDDNGRSVRGFKVGGTD